MNTILQQRIEEAAEEYANSTTSNLLNVFETTGRFEGFEQGATFALQNQWISVDEELPEFEGNFSDYYIIRTESGWCAVTMYYRTSEKEYWWNFEKVKVTHWMPIPSLK